MLPSQNHACAARARHQAAYLIRHVAFNQAYDSTPFDDPARGYQSGIPNRLQEVDFEFQRCEGFSLIERGGEGQSHRGVCDIAEDSAVKRAHRIGMGGAGGTCVVRVVHSLFASADDWDNQLEGWEYGWPGFFRILWLYLTHFRGQRGSAMQLGNAAPEPKSEAWAALTSSLGLAGATMGKRVRTPTGAPPLAGLIERVGEDPFPEELLLRLDEPAPGIAHLFAMDMGGQVYLSIRLYLYGDQAPAAVARDEPLWQAWMNKPFPSDGKGIESSSC